MPSTSVYISASLRAKLDRLKAKGMNLSALMSRGVEDAVDRALAELEAKELAEVRSLFRKPPKSAVVIHAVAPGDVLEAHAALATTPAEAERVEVEPEPQVNAVAPGDVLTVDAALTSSPPTVSVSPASIKELTVDGQLLFSVFDLAQCLGVDGDDLLIEIDEEELLSSGKRWFTTQRGANQAINFALLQDLPTWEVEEWLQKRKTGELI